jgi:hypothetical protein
MTNQIETAAQHSPAPWVAEGWQNVTVNDANGYTICTMPGGTDLMETKANARLIASAPALLEALVRLADRFAFDGVPEDGAEEYNEAVAAIRAARRE